MTSRDDDFAGKVAWVAGAARPPGMGRSVAVQLARRGADVACVDVVVPEPAADQAYEVSREALEGTADAVRAEGRRALVLPVDLTDAESVDESVRATVGEFGRIDVCANLSGGTGPRLGTSKLVDLEADNWHRTIDANLTAMFLGSRACACQMIEQGSGGAIVSLASSAGVTGEPNFGAFSAARAGVIRLTEVLAAELGPHGIRANAVCPLGVSPDKGGGNPGLVFGAVRRGVKLDDWITGKIPLGRMQSPDETAAVMVFLVSDEASFVSGEHVIVAGGAHV